MARPFRVARTADRPRGAPRGAPGAGGSVLAVDRFGRVQPLDVAAALVAVNRLEVADGIVDRHRAVLAAPGQDDLAGREYHAFGDDPGPGDTADVLIAD